MLSHIASALVDRCISNTYLQKPEGMARGTPTVVSEFLLLRLSEVPEPQPLLFRLFLAVYLVTTVRKPLITLATSSCTAPRVLQSQAVLHQHLLHLCHYMKGAGQNHVHQTNNNLKYFIRRKY